jgi:uncharacterized lipoprotein YddW (UPF0748 family)
LRSRAIVPGRSCTIIFNSVNPLNQIQKRVPASAASIYLAHDRGLKVHVWVDETRPRNQGASLTAWESSHHGVAHIEI